MRFRATKLHKEASQILPFLQLPPGTRPAVDQRPSKLDGCRAEVDDATPQPKHRFSERLEAPWLSRPSRGLCRDACTNESMGHDSLEMPVRSGAHNKGKGLMEDVHGCLPGRSVSQRKDQLTRRSSGQAVQRAVLFDQLAGLDNI